MKFFDRFKKKPVPPPVDNRTKFQKKMMAASRSSTNWKKPFQFMPSSDFTFSSSTLYNPTQNRRRANYVYQKSLIGKNLIRRSNDNVINTGLTWESSPIWDLIKDAPKEKEDQYKYTKRAENYWKLYSNSKECDAQGVKTGSQIQRMVERMANKEGEFYVIYRYLNNPKRISPVALQIINNEQVVNPTDRKNIEAIKKRGGTVKHGLEFDSQGLEVAIHVYQPSGHTTRIPFFAKKSGRRFVTHYVRAEDPSQFRGLPELTDLDYEIDKLAEYYDAELEATVESARFLGAIESDVGAAPPKPKWSINDIKKEEESDSATENYVDQRGKAILLNDLGDGRKLKMYQPTRPNQNFEKYIDSEETRIGGTQGMPLSVYKQLFQGSYSSARAEILFYWNSVLVRRDDISGFLNEWIEVVISEWVRAGVLSAPGFDSPIMRKAWLNGTWTGISRPVVDPVKEAKAVEIRTKLGHTTGEKEAKAHNGSDYQENVERLKTENQTLAEANEPLDPSHYAKAPEAKEKDDD